MKKISQKNKNFQNKKSKFSRKNRNSKLQKIPIKVEIWDGLKIEEAICKKKPMIPPEKICFIENLDETLIFLKNLREAIGKKETLKKRKNLWIRRRENKLPTIVSYCDFSKIKKLSVSSALIIAASYDRAKQIASKVPPVVNYNSWSNETLHVLYEIGFFKLISSTFDVSKPETYDEKKYSDIKILKAMSGFNANNIPEFSDKISILLQFLFKEISVHQGLLIEMNSAIGEAMSNVSAHAYPMDYISTSDYVTVKRWWVTARIDRSISKLTLVIYDQGASIPGTLQKKDNFIVNFTRWIRGIFTASTINHGNLDHEYIDYSMISGKTQTQTEGRGLGLPQMQDLLDKCTDGTLTVISRRGLCRYKKGTKVQKIPLETGLEGTLVEWDLQLPMGGS